MQLHTLLRQIVRSDSFDWARFPSRSQMLWQSVAAESRPFLVAAAYLAEPRKTLIVTTNYERCLAWQARLRLLGIKEHLIFQMPGGTSSLFEDATPEHTALSDRIGALEALIKGEQMIVIAEASAALERTLPRDILSSAFINLKVGQTVELDKLIQNLVNLGYEHQEPVRVPGQFSQRGGILDLFASGFDLPTRIELFGDEIESIREFDPNTQRSTMSVESLSLTPSRETLYVGGEAELASFVRLTLDREVAGLGGEAGPRLEELVKGDLEAIESRIFFDRLDLYRPLLHPDSGCAIDLLAEDDVLILDEPLELDTVVNRAQEELEQALTARVERGEILQASVNDYVLHADHLGEHQTTLAMTAMNQMPDWMATNDRFDAGSTSLAPYRGLG